MKVNQCFSLDSVKEYNSQDTQSAIKFGMFVKTCKLLADTSSQGNVSALAVFFIVGKNIHMSDPFAL